MNRILVDANALVSFLTDRKPEQQNKIRDLLDEALKGNSEIILHQHALSEMVFVLKNVYRIGTETIAKMLRDLIEQPGTIATNELYWHEVLELWPSRIPDFGDALLASVALNRKLKILTFDKSFQKQLNKLKIEQRP